MFRDLGGVAAAEAGGTESAAVLCQFLYVFHTEVPQRVGSDDLADLFPGVMDRNEGVPGVNVRAIIAGIQEGGRGDPQMYLGSASLPRLWCPGRWSRQ